jgi:hypothetical protein
MLYTYNVSQDNKNGRTLAMFSTGAHDKMRPCPHCELYIYFLRFVQFYGSTDFAHRWITTALTGNRTVFDSSTADFQSMSLEGRAGMCAAAFGLV